MAQKSLEERVQRLEDIHEIQNMMSRYAYGRQELDYALKTPGASAETADWGVYVGAEGLDKLERLHSFHVMDPKGIMFMHPLTTPVIEIAEDGKTARGVWISPGHETVPYEGKLTAFWAWCKFGVDFVKEDGKWKIWHNHVYAIFRCPYDKSWVEESNTDIDPIPEEFKPDLPTTYHHPYSPTTVIENVPEPPAPYETWDPKHTYGPPEQ